MVFNVIPLMMAMSYLLTKGKDVADFTNDLFNNLVTVSSDSHQARMAQDIFRQEIRYAKSLQIREDIRDQRKVMLESVTSYLYFGSMVLAASFVTLIEGFPPLGTSRAVLLWWLVFGLWSLTYQLLALWYALCFQVKLSQCARERLLRRYRYRVADDRVVDKMGGKSLVNTYSMLLSGIRNVFTTPERDEPVESTEKAPDKLVSVHVTNLNSKAPLDVTRLTKQMHAWTHSSGQGYDKNTLVDMPYYLLNETLIRSPWTFSGETPLVFRVRGEATLYIAGQCPPVGRSGHDSKLSMTGVNKAFDNTMKDWPNDELPIVTAGYHAAWRGDSGHGEFRRVDGGSLFVDAEFHEIPVYKIVLASPRDGPDGYVDVVVCWQFETNCEAMCIMLRKGAVHCQEDDWPMAEFNAEICQIMPLQDHSGAFMRRGTSFLVLNMVMAVLSRLWLLGERPVWWLETFIMLVVLLPMLAIMCYIPVNIKSTFETVSMSAINRVPNGLEDFDTTAADDITYYQRRDRQAAEDEQLRQQSQVRIVDAAPMADSLVPRRPPSPVATDESPARLPRQSGGRVGAGIEDREGEAEVTNLQLVRADPAVASGDAQLLWPPLPSGGDPSVNELPPVTSNVPILQCCDVELSTSRSRQTLNTGSPTSPPLFRGAPLPVAPTASQPSGPCSQGPARASPQVLRAENGGYAAAGPGAPATALRSRPPVLPNKAFSAPDIGAGLGDSAATSSGCCPRRLKDFQSFLLDLSGLRSFASLPDSTADNSVARTLFGISRLLDFLLFFTFFVVMSSPSIAWFSAPLALGVNPAYKEAGDDNAKGPPERRLLDLAGAETLKWIEIPVAWPPFLHPTAAVLDAGGTFLHVASASILWTLGTRVQGRSSAEFSVLGSPVIFPEALQGLGFSGNSLVAIGDSAAYQLARDELDTAQMAPDHAEQGLLDLASIATQAGSIPSPRWSHKLGPVGAAVHLQVSRHNVSSPATVIATRGGDLNFCAPTEPSRGQPGMLTQLESLGQPLQNISGLHVSVASEMVLWAANRSGCIAALGLSTGRSFGSFDALAGLRTAARKRMRGHSPTRSLSRILALTGNSTHLCMVAGDDQCHPALLCAPYPALGEGDDLAAEL